MSSLATDFGLCEHLLHRVTDIRTVKGASHATWCSGRTLAASVFKYSCKLTCCQESSVKTNWSNIA